MKYNMQIYFTPGCGLWLFLLQPIERLTQEVSSREVVKLGQTSQEPRLPGLAQPRVEHAQGAEAAAAQYTRNALVGHLQGQYRTRLQRSRYLAAPFAVQQG